jgi:predicted nuclease of predicted toxin-antitoxin system
VLEPARIRFYVDEHVPTAITKGLQRRGVDVVTVGDRDALSAADEAHLALAAAEMRVVFTQDADFLRLHAEGIPHAGIVYAHQ